MTKHFQRFVPISVWLTMCVVSAQTPSTARVHIENVQSHSGSRLLSKATSIVVHNSAATSEEVKLNKAALNRMRTRVSGSQNDETAKLAYKIVDDFSESLIKDLQPIGFPLTGKLPPAGSLAVQGDFLLIDEGNTARRTVIGLGASKVEVRVECYLKQTDNNIVTEFTLESFEEAWPRGTMGAGAAPEAAATVSAARNSNKAPKVTRIDWRKPSQRKSEKRWQPKAG